ncbi:MAG: PAS domain-containing protein [Desulfobacula sp.]|jgi:two-component system, NtrC family, sensor histidine kinase HydH|uniref:two-component system sensor histidine kinase NtrB n=1 Tax=Desulfobacula sp. TaxID=2593537 RepID=UPI001DEA32B0|nr:PAS domain-containing protein [Desulfobacula sp.]MBT3486531.1 PAS domain-containing protein [Desulfobacula sp.]MBT3805321.1 PAS domain-containing protein [Desulfobacula sp.]MBT4025673.1 PAS domain-containing protein [Desulfobacula sp.]MBT4197514.1 PAS domain-containing protein [Desulfobacula sp.]
MKKYKFPLISPIFLIGVLLIMLPIFTFMTLDRLEKEKEFFTQRLLEKGVSLIRTFEAGTRTGMFTMRWGAKRIQAMLLETALQPEVIYMMIISKDGRILAHSDASMVGQVFDALSGTQKMNEDTTLVHHRVRLQKDQTQVFEVFKRFVPIRSRSMRGHMMMDGAPGPMHFASPDLQNFKKRIKDWSRHYMQDQDGKTPEMAEHYIFAGLSMERAQIGRDRLLKETVWRGVLFFILGCVGMVALFAFQAYRSAKDSLTSIKAFSDNVIQNMPSGLVTINSDHEITSVNNAAKNILGEDLTQPYPEMIELIQEMEVSKDLLNREVNFNIAQDRKLGLDITASPIKGSENQIMGFLFLFRDLTQIRELKKQVETNKRLAAIGKLAAGVAHEIRNPLSSIKGFATYFGKRYEDKDSDKEIARIMVKEVERINRSVTQLLEFAKPMAIEKKQVDIKEMITHSLKLVHHDLGQKNIETRVNIDTKKKIIHTDGDRMNQVLLNLYINAIEALDDKGILEIQVQDTKTDDQIQIRVKDNGKGIDEESLDLIFDPYFTTRSTGTGLGLSIVHRIIENLEAGIRVESKKNTGTCFIINLPV